jgi:hypothetical protein
VLPVAERCVSRAPLKWTVRQAPVMAMLLVAGRADISGLLIWAARGRRAESLFWAASSTVAGVSSAGVPNGVSAATPVDLALALCSLATATTFLAAEENKLLRFGRTGNEIGGVPSCAGNRAQSEA